MFEVIAEVSQPEIRDALLTHVPLWGPLFLRWSDGAFPANGWTDFVGVLLPRWFANVRTLTYGLADEVRQEFMDESPRFAFLIQMLAEDQIELRFLEWNKETAPPLAIPLATYAGALAKAGKGLIYQLELETGSSYPLVEELKRAVAFYQGR